jgi:hypothetical protein
MRHLLVSAVLLATNSAPALAITPEGSWRFGGLRITSAKEVSPGEPICNGKAIVGRHSIIDAEILGDGKRSAKLKFGDQLSVTLYNPETSTWSAATFGGAALITLSGNNSQSGTLQFYNKGVGYRGDKVVDDFPASFKIGFFNQGIGPTGYMQVLFNLTLNTFGECTLFFEGFFTR